jgi:hypothetical protein
MNYNPAPDTFVYRKIEIEPWQLWFAWRPVKTISGERIWFKKVYRRCCWHYSDHNQWAKEEYANIFDILKK